jgi:thiamine kinase-like enzyme
VIKTEDHSCSPVENEPLKRGLTAALSEYFNAPCRIIHLQRDISDYSSSYSVEELQLELENGSTLKLIFKNLSSSALLDDARRSRPEFLLDPRREIEVYRSILNHNAMDTATCYGSIIDENNDHFWLFLEKVPAVELYQVGEFETWLKVAQWLAGLHKQFSGKIETLVNEVPLLRYDQDFYALWPRRAQLFSLQNSTSSQVGIKRLVNNYDKVIERLLSLPTTLVHGDFYASNILVQNAPEGLRICPVDWEMAAAGPGLVDLAALVSGQWSTDEETALISAYLHTLYPGQLSQLVQQKIFEDVAYCQLHIALQWLGWAAAWSPPKEHQTDWLQQALRLVDRLGL